MTEPTNPIDPSPCSGFDAPGDCRDAATELHTFLDGALTDDKRQKIADHLDACSGCFDAFEFHTELRQLISERCHCSVPDGLRDRIRASLAELAAMPVDEQF